jgi:Protein of unknown function (DUF2380)
MMRAMHMAPETRPGRQPPADETAPSGHAPRADPARWRRREGLAAALGLALGVMSPQLRAQQPQALPRLAFLGFEVIDEQPDPARAPELRRRLEMIGQQMAEGLAARGLYQLVDLAPAAPLLAQTREQNEFIYRCNGCLAELGPALNLRLVATGWVQRVSGLILNINLQVQDVVADRLLLTRSVDIRGDNDESWRRGAAHLLRDLAERREREPGYGR